jgi:deoxyribodipyrimidine photo-lyase
VNDVLKSRIYPLKAVSTKGECVIYVMSRDQRVGYNHALLAAQKHALIKKLPLAVVFCLYPKVKNASREHYDFLLDGLRGVEGRLKDLNIPLMTVIGDPYDKLSAVFNHTKPDAVYFDFSPLRGPMNLQKSLAEGHEISMYQVDTHNVVPTRVVSQKMEVGAYTLRPKIHKLLSTYLVAPEEIVPHPSSWPGTIQSLASLNVHINEMLADLPSNGTTHDFESGETAGKERLEAFIGKQLDRYAIDRNDPSLGSQSDLSPYLHFGQLSALEVALRLQEVARQAGVELHILNSPKMPKPEDAQTTTQHGIDALIEEMIVRKELADNYCLWNPLYDQLVSAPAWARTSLDKHRSDVREYLYTKDQFEHAQTHDEAWNAAQRQLTRTGKMHGYMRMYWAKKVLEWSNAPEDAIEILVYLNDFYSIDGRDPNGYAGILWSVGGVHDRPWAERDIFGVVRYMNYGGLKRKFAIEDYQKQW